MNDQERAAISDLREVLRTQLEIYGQMLIAGKIELAEMDKLLELRCTEEQLSDYVERISRYWQRTAAAEKAAGA